MLALLSIGFMAVFFRLADIMLINHDWYLLKARGQQDEKRSQTRSSVASSWTAAVMNSR